MKNHLKRIAAPKSWIINRREKKYIVRPSPSGHALGMGLPLGLILRDFLKLASTMNEVKKMLRHKEVQVDGIRRFDYSFMVGLFDVIAIPALGKAYRIVFDTKGRVVPVEAGADQNVKLCKIIGKTVLRGKKIQYHLHDGKNLVLTHTAKVGDSLKLGLPKLDVQEILPLQVGANVFLTQGKHRGDIGVLAGVKGSEATYTVDGSEIETAKEYLFVIGGKKSAITIR